MVEPLSIGVSTIATTSRPYSAGRPMRFAHGDPLRRSRRGLLHRSEWHEALCVGRLAFSRVAPMRFVHGDPLRRSKSYFIALVTHSVVTFLLKSGATAEVLQLAQTAGIPITTTLLGIGVIPASSPLNLGMMGMHGEAWVNQAIQQADLLIALGMRFDDRVTGNLKTYAPHARKIHV